MKIAVFVMLSALASAAPWDGKKGDFTLTTWASAPGQTTFTVTCSNPTITAFRFKVVFTSPAGDLRSDVVRVVDLFDLRARRGTSFGSVASFVVPLDQSSITGTPQITPLYDGAAIEF